MKCAYKDCHANAARRVRIPGPVDRSLDVCLVHERLLEDMMAKSKCALPTCDNVANGAKGCCTIHYGRWYPRRWLDGLATVTPEQATDFQARWEQATAEREAKRTERADAPVKPTHPDVLSEVKPGRWSRLVPDPVPEERDVKPTVPPVQGEIVRLTARVKELEEQVRELSAAHDRMVEDAKALREENRRLDAEVERFAALDRRMEPVREALSALGLPAMDSYADAVRYVVRQRDRALADAEKANKTSHAAEAQLADLRESLAKAQTGAAEQIKTARHVSTVPSDTLAEPAYLSHLLTRDTDLRIALEAAITRDLALRVEAKDSAALLSLLTGPVSRLP